MSQPLLLLAVGLLVSFVGTLPFGPINLSVVKLTVDSNRLRGLEMSLAASLVEMVQVSIALWFGMVISGFLSDSLLFRIAAAVAFIVLALLVWLRPQRLSLAGSEAAEKSFFRRGILIAALNPQAIPFWIFALAVIDQYFDFSYGGIALLLFLAGVFLGKLLALYGFVVASDYLKAHLSESSRLVNRVLAAVLLFIGLGQAFSALSMLTS